MRNILFILGTALLLIVTWGCKSKNEPLTPENQAKLAMQNSSVYKKEVCFDAGGVEYQVGRSGGSNHEVCIFRKGTNGN